MKKNTELSPSHKPILEPHRSFCLHLSNNSKDTIITFNYDLLFEQELWLQNKWTFLDGWGIKKDVRSFEDNSNRYPDNKPKQSKVIIYKLHGSVCWVKSYPSGVDIFFEIPIIFFPGYTGLPTDIEYYPNTKAPDRDHGTTLIDPSYLKSFENKKIKELWLQAELAIRKCDELFIIGYSFPTADMAAQQLIARAVRESKISKIVIINPDHTVINKAEILLGRKVLFMLNKFEDWVKLNFTQNCGV